MPLASPIRSVNFDPADWYWFVGGDLTQVYSSAAAAYVPSRDPTFVAWVNAGYTATRIDSEQELWDYLNGRVLNGTPPTATSTDAAKDARIADQLSEVIYQIAFSHENRIRVLEGLTTITQDAFYSRVKGLMK